MTGIIRENKEVIDYLMRHFPCVAVLGARQVGKTTLTKQVLPKAPYFDLEKSSDFERIDNDPEFFLKEQNYPIIIDEAQFCPKLFNAIRVKIDEKRKRNGLIIISGSSSPSLLKSISETLAGRVALVELGTFSWNEAYQKKMSGFYDCLINKDIKNILKLKQLYSNKQLIDLCLKGAYPEPFLIKDNKTIFDTWMENYINLYINRDIRRLFPTLKIETYQRFIKMLVYSSGDLINYSNFASSLDVSQPTIKNYFTIAEGTFLWRSLSSYNKNLSKRVVKMPKGHIRDSGLICHYLNLNNSEDLLSYPKYGHIWEGFVIEQIIKSLKIKLASFTYHYYRTRNQAELDLIIDGKFGRYALEVKAGNKVNKKELNTLKKFVSEHKCQHGFLINNGEEIFKISENITQVPASYL